MAAFQFRILLSICCIPILYFNSFAQNLVPNWSFEEYTTCPTFVAQLGLAAPWGTPTNTTPDYLNACATHPSVGVPSNAFGYQNAHSGVAYAGAQFRSATFSNREYLTTALLEPLVTGFKYEVSFWVSLADEYCGTTEIGAYFSSDVPGPPGTFGVLEVVPQIKSTLGFVTDTANWVLISGCFIPTGGEQYMTIGNFTGEYDTPVDSVCALTNPYDHSYYFVDDVSVYQNGPPGSYDLELGDPVFSCDPILIDPEISGVNFYWEGGSNDSTLIVTESGFYTLTVTSGCTQGIDSIDVSINGVEDVDLGPEEVTICFGDTYTIVLDPDWSEYFWQDGSTDATYSITTPGLYQVTMDDGCAVSSDEILINVVADQGSAFLGEDTFICPDDQIEYNFDPAAGEYLWQDNSTSPYYSITEPGNYTLTISNVCGVFTDAIEITLLNSPSISLGPDSIYVCSGDSVLFEFDQDMGVFDWQDNSHNPTYLITSPGIYALTVTNDCGSDVDQTEIFMIEPPIFYLGQDTNLCPGDSLILDGDGVEGLYAWQDTTSSNVYQVNSSGMYSLTVSNACGMASDTVSVTFSSVFGPPDLGPDITLCPGEQYVLYAGVPEANYLWQDSSMVDSLLIASAGTYTLQVYNNCVSFSDTIEVTYNNIPPQVELPNQLTLCQGQSITLDAGISGVTYLWSDNSQNQQLLVIAPGTYSLTVSNACGADQDSVTILDGGPAPVVTLGSDVQICAGDHVLLTPSFSNVDTWLWQDGSALPSFDISSAGLITVTVSNACGVAYDTLLVDFLPATPPLDLGPDTSLCSWQSFTLSIQTPGVSVLWADGSTNPDFIVSGPGEVTASISNACGSAFDTIIFDALPDIPILDLGPDQSLCPGEIISVDPGISDVNYLWHNGSINNTYQSTQQESIILTISNDCGSSTDTLEIIESTQGPQVNLGPDIQECEGAIITIPSGISGVTYLWQDGSTDPDFTTAQSGVFILQVSNNCGADTDTINVDISGVPPTVVFGPDTTLCEGATLVLVSNADVITSIQWQDGSSAPTYTVSSPGTFTLAESNRCGDASDTIVVSYLDAPDPFSLGPDTVLCPGESITLTSPSSSFDILWQDGSSDETIIADQPITYSLQLSNDCGTISDELLLSFDTRIPVLDLGPDQEWCEGDIFTLDATQPFFANYLWSNGSTSPSIQITTPGIYTVDVSTLCSTASQYIDITPGTDCKTSEVHADMYIPNVFSPNGDGINDVFIVSFGQALVVTGMTGSIFDRWGNLVFGSEAIPFSWDGKLNDEDMMPGVYVLVLRWSFNDQGVIRTDVVHRDITLLR